MHCAGCTKLISEHDRNASGLRGVRVTQMPPVGQKPVTLHYHFDCYRAVSRREPIVASAVVRPLESRASLLYADDPS